MPSINPDNYNIDNLDSINLGPISVTDFRTYILNYNLQNVNPEVQSLGYGFYPRGVYIGNLWNPNQNIQDLPNLSTLAFTPSLLNNSTQPRPDNLSKNLYTNNSPFYGSPTGQENYEVVEKSLSDPGSLDGWVAEGNFYTDVSTIRNMVNLSNNEYGPEFISAYNDLGNISDTTGYKQYPTASNADVLGPLIAKTLGFSTTGAIDFPSDLQTIRNERLAEELKNRITLNFISDTIGSINLDPLGLLGGQNLFTPNYTITVPPGFLGKAAQFTADLVGFNVPTSIIPGSVTTTKLGSNGFQDDLLEYTGKGQRDLLYANVYSSKYAPNQLTDGFDPKQTDTSKILGKLGDIFDGTLQQTGNNYLKLSPAPPEEEKTLSQKFGNFVNNLLGPNVDKSLASNVESDSYPQDPFVSMGLDGSYPAIEGLDPNSSFNNEDLNSPSYLIPGATVEYYPNKTTLKPSLFDSDDIEGSFTHTTPSTNRIFDWRSRSQPIAKRGLLKYTQDMINNSEANGNKGAAKYIGRFNSNSNLIQGQKDIGDGRVVNVPRHKDVSMGNLVRSGDDSFYCRSWSSRNPYQNHYDLIRRDKLYRMLNKNFFGNYLSVLEDSGHVKVAPTGGEGEAFQTNSSPGSLGNASVEVKRYMLSIENLAWTDAPEKIGLPYCEIGPNGGRIMWFPPYDIDFNESVTTNWETTNFIGRGEPIYTYNYTERKGTLSFSIVTDHPSVVNQMKKETEQTLYKFFAGCGVDVTKYFETQLPIIKPETTVQVVEEQQAQQTVVVPQGTEEKPLPETPKRKDPPTSELECYFRNARRSTTGSNGLRTGDGRDISIELAVKYELPGSSIPTSDTKKTLNLNQKFVDDIDALIDFLATEDGQYWGIQFIGYTSGAAPKNYNKVLSIDRATSVFKYVTEQIKIKGQTGGTGYTYDETNFTTSSVGYKCVSSLENCLKATETSKLNINGLNIIDQAIPEGNVFDSRWVIWAKGEDGADSKNDEDASFGNNDPNAEKAMKDRKVKIKLFENTKYQTTEQIIAFTPEPLPDDITFEPPPPTVIAPGPNAGIEVQGLTGSSAFDLFKSEQSVNNLTQLNQAEQKAQEDYNKANVGTNNKTGDDVNSLVEDSNVKSKNEEIAKRTVQALFSECSYFEKIRKEDPFVYETINDKIKNFHPAFHSITPEGFNERLTFLHQCTRQGPSVKPKDVATQNLAFGRPPICVLRIGDFYYTKIVIDSLTISYEPLIWDMNPEGVGVQPMIAKVDLGFSFIGGSSIDGPIKQLQNAVSFNFFANTSVFNPRRYYKVGDDENFETLTEKLKADAEALVKTNSQYIGYGSFASQSQADAEINDITRVNTPADNQTQTADINTKSAAGAQLPAGGQQLTSQNITVNNNNTIAETLAPGNDLNPASLDMGQSVFANAFSSNNFDGSGGVFSASDEKQIKIENPGTITPSEQVKQEEENPIIIEKTLGENNNTKIVAFKIKEEEKGKWQWFYARLEPKKFVCDVDGDFVGYKSDFEPNEGFPDTIVVNIENETIEIASLLSGCTGPYEYKLYAEAIPVKNGQLDEQAPQNPNGRKRASKRIEVSYKL